MRARTIITACAAALALAPAAGADRGMFVGAAEDSAKADLVTAKAEMTLARLAGYNAIRMTAIWEPGKSAPASTELIGLKNAVDAAALNGIRIVLSVYHYNSKTTPLTPQARREFAQYTAALARALPSVTDYIIGNEPNLNLFWMPQFNLDGSSASPGAYVELLAETYDALKAVNAKINVIGGSVSPRGQDKHDSKRHTHSPTRFIPEMGKAYRALNRAKPIMDSFAFHPYLEPGLPPTFQHPKSTTVSLNDYSKLIALLGQAFDGTKQAGSKVPIIYDEFGYESAIPPARESAYHGREPASIKTVDEATMGLWYKQALELAYCQPTVKGFLFFLVSDEANHDRWQSGVYYADDTPKSFFNLVRQSAIAVRNGTLTTACAGAASAAPAKPAKPKKVKPQKSKPKKSKPAKDKGKKK